MRALKKYYASQERFQSIDGNNFGACLKQVVDNDICIEWRIRKEDGMLCIIQLYEDNKGYTIFKQETE